MATSRRAGQPQLRLRPPLALEAPDAGWRCPALRLRRGLEVYIRRRARLGSCIILLLLLPIPSSSIPLFHPPPSLPPPSPTMPSSTIATGLSTPQAPPALPDNVLALFSLKGKVACISGASSGIGHAVARAFAQAGADIAVWYNSHDSLIQDAQQWAAEFGVRARAYKCPVTDEARVKATIAQVVQDFGRIDVFVANAGVPWEKGPLLEAEERGEAADEWQRVLHTDFQGVYYCSKHAGAVFKRQGRGSLVITASMSGHVVNVPQLQTCYNAVKAGVLHMARSLAVEWAGFARVNTVSPGYIATPISVFAEDATKQRWHELTPLGREGLPQELVGAYLYLASDASTFTTGSDIVVDGGYCAM
ncbi:LAFE_0G14620g1_1 [Lachancea fermentati]|uniref:LAFE_0G14620g1_1 n=1 Tax=Lachancea fermentati TaxID=4955 RepID=A0A1G4MIQ7_LACFM|nr:LAFE_0G14620g1_1 [Lachancea fermentati]